MSNSSRKQNSINLITNLLAFVINAGINFFLTPYLLEQLGTESYGFIGLANDFVGYANIFAMALNTMSGRFIAVSYHRGEKEKANRYMNSVFMANVILGAVVALAGVFIVWKLEYIINIPTYLMSDVKITFALVFANYLLSIIISVLNCAPFIKNKMNLVYIRNIISYLIKLIFTIGLLILFDIKIYIISLVTLICTVYLMVANGVIFRKLLPEFRLSSKGFSLAMIKEILSSGIWMSLLSLSNLLLSGLNSLLTNKFISPVAMGYLNVSKTIPNYISQLGQQLGTVFAPEFTKHYAEGEIDTLISEAKKAIKIMSFIMIVPVAGFIVFGNEFYTLWLKDYTADEISTIQALSVIITVPYLINGIIYPLVQIHNALNKIKLPVIATFIIGIINILIILPLGSFNKLTLIALTVSSSVLQCLRNAVFQPIYAAKILKQKWYIFVLTELKYFLVFGGISLLFYVGKSFINISSWLTFIIWIAVFAVIGYAVLSLIIFSRSEIKELLSSVKSKFKRQ